jgi:hypothetical protein
MQEFLAKLEKEFNLKNILIASNVLLVFFLIWLFNLGVLPFARLGDFIFFAFLGLALSLYRPGWIFLFFCGTLVLENITLIPAETGLAVRPYQFLGFLLLGAIGIRFLVKRLNFEFIKLKWYDYAVGIFVLSGFWSLLWASPKTSNLKQAVIIFSFAIFYWLVRNFVQNSEDLKRVMPFFLGSSAVVVAYGIWQNVAFIKNLPAFEVMPGRPNGTFAEADWLAGFLVLVISGIYALIYFLFKNNNDKNFINSNFLKIFFYLFLVFSYVLLAITVARSAWLGMAVATVIFLGYCLFSDWKVFWRQFVFVVSAGIISLAAVYFLNLTSFQLFDRVESVGTGLQEITISCQQEAVLPEKIATSEELIRYGCRHINLEEIPLEAGQGNFITKIYRNDPNVSVRSEIYQKVWQEIKKHPLVGIGWGNISSILGQDARGAGLNASNIFLEIWLGAGLFGLLAFLVIWIYIPGKAVYNMWRAERSLDKAVALFAFISWFGFTVFNLFNAGIMLGFFWAWLAVVISLLSEDKLLFEI